MRTCGQIGPRHCDIVIFLLSQISRFIEKVSSFRMALISPSWLLHGSDDSVHIAGPLEDLHGGPVRPGFPSEPRARGLHSREAKRRLWEVIVHLDVKAKTKEFVFSLLISLLIC